MSKHMRLDKIFLEKLKNNFDSLDYRETCLILLEECQMLMEDIDEAQEAIDALVEACHFDRNRKKKCYSDNY